MRPPKVVPLPAPPLRDEMVALRRWDASDAGALEQAGSDAAIRRFRASHPRSPSEVQAWLAAVEPARLDGRGLELAGADRDGAAVWGSVTLWAVSQTHRSAMVNYWVAAEARGRGVASRAVRLLAGWCFASLHLARLQLFIDPANVPSMRVAQRCGFVREGLLRSHMEQPDGRRHDSVLYGLLPGELRSPELSSPPTI